jgi:DNA-binding NtrC family response regulator
LPLKIIYLDDEPDLGSMFADNFASDQVTIETYTDATAAIAAVQAACPDAFFVDYRLPGTTGDEVAQKLPPDLPKILITGDLAVAPVTKFVKIFNKPFDFAEMETFIAALKPLKA